MYQRDIKHPFVLMAKWNDYKHITVITEFTKVSWGQWADMRWAGITSHVYNQSAQDR